MLHCGLFTRAKEFSSIHSCEVLGFACEHRAKTLIDTTALFLDSNDTVDSTSKNSYMPTQ